MASRDMGGMGRTAGRGQFGRMGLGPKIRSVRPTVPTKIKDNLAKELASFKAANKTAQKALPKGVKKEIVVGGAFNLGVASAAGLASRASKDKTKPKPVRNAKKSSGRKR